MTNSKIPTHIEQTVAVDGVLVFDATRAGAGDSGASDQEIENFLHARGYRLFFAHSLQHTPALKIAARSAVALEDRIQWVTGVCVKCLEPVDSFGGFR